MNTNDSGRDSASTSGHRQSILYRMRARHLAALARMLDEAGRQAAVAELRGMPVLYVTGTSGTRHRITIAAVDPRQADWFHWDGHPLAPRTRPEMVAQAVASVAASG